MDELPQKLKFNQPATVRVGELENLKVTTIEGPPPKYLWIVYQKVLATWQDKPLTTADIVDHVSDEELRRTFMDVIRFKTLPNSMEAINFTFLVEGLPLVEITHLLRHRTISGVHAQCSGDRDLRDDIYYMPPAISRDPEFRARYLQLIKDAVVLYCHMVDSKDVSIMDARYILPRAGSYFYYFTVNLKDLINMINQRKCTMVQPELDNQLAKLLMAEAIKFIPELKEVLTPLCGKSCHYIHSPADRNTRLYDPDKNHKSVFNSLALAPPSSVYKKTREEMGSRYDKNS